MIVPDWLHASLHLVEGVILIAAAALHVSDGFAPYLAAAGSAMVGLGVTELATDTGLKITPAQLDAATKILVELVGKISASSPPPEPPP